MHEESRCYFLKDSDCLLGFVHETSDFTVGLGQQSKSVSATSQVSQSRRDR